MTALDCSLDRTGLVPPDRDASAWPLPPDDQAFEFGSEAHKIAFCRVLLDTFDPYRPAVLDWPALDAEARNRITSLPIWDIAVQTEGKAGARIQNYADVLAEPLVRKALDLNAFEERRHKVVLSCLVRAYGIPLEPEPDYEAPRDRLWAYMVTGFSECIDSFFAFGLFEAARRSGFFPEELVETFEPVVQEEARHILFFVNWVAWHRRHLGPGRRILFELKIWAVWAYLAYERLNMASSIGDAEARRKETVRSKRDDNNFTTMAAAHVTHDVDVRGLLELCLAENDRRLSRYDSRLLRPRVFPALVRLALPLIGGRKKAA